MHWVDRRQLISPGRTCGRDGIGSIHGFAGGANGKAQSPGGGALQQDDEPEFEEGRRRRPQPRLPAVQELVSIYLQIYKASVIQLRSAWL